MRDPGIRDRGGELKVGVLVLGAAVVLVAALFWVSNARLSGPDLRLHGVSPEAGQISKDARVFFLGVEVGQVSSVRLDGFRVLIDLSIYEALDLPVDTRGQIKPAGFLGAQMVELIPGVASRLLQDGDTIHLGRQGDLQSLAADLSGETSVVLDRLQDVLSEETVEGVQGSTRSFASAMQELESLVAAERQSLHAMIDGLERTSGRLAELTTGPELASTLASLDTLTVRLSRASETFERTSTSLAAITERLERGEGSLGRMLTDDRLYDEMTEAMSTLRAASEEVALLMKDVRDRPDRYLRDIDVRVF